MRIFIGGVSPSVTAEDIEKTFSSLGSVSGIELVHTNARNIAYMNFEPNSEKTLSKLFSTYNGCTWKGGKLKLERAREHYLERLKREWAEDAKLLSEPEDAKLLSEPAVHPNVEKDVVSSKLERLNLENMELRIFFPKLRKVKSLPFKGTGKHKYSFQRIEVPPLPIHFCDCEEHHVHSEVASVGYISSLNRGVHYEKELCVMNSVMNKLFNKKNEENATKKVATSAVGNISDLSIGDKHEKSEEALEMETDNLVTNIWIGRRDETVMHLRERESLTCQEARAGKRHPAKNGAPRSKANIKKRKIVDGHGDSFEITTNGTAHSEKMPFIATENEFTAILPQKTSTVGHSQEPEVSAEPVHGTGQMELSTVTIQSRRGKSWLQKSSWRDLVGESGSTSFSITNVLPDISSLPPKQHKNLAIEAGAGKHHPAKNESPQSKVKKKRKIVADPGDSFEVTANGEALCEKRPFKAIENEFTVLPQKTSIVGRSQELKVAAEPLPGTGQMELSTVSIQSGRGKSWLHKSSWRDLVGESGSTSFSITNILPDISSLSPNQHKLIYFAIEAPAAEKKVKSPRVEQGFQDASAVQDVPSEKVSGDKKPGKGGSIQSNTGFYHIKGLQNSGGQEPRRTISEAGASELCTFMRTAESEKQWAKVRAALSKRLKKNDKKDNGSDSYKSIRPQKR